MALRIDGKIISTEVKDRLDDCLWNLSFAIRLHGWVLEPLTTEYAVLVEQILSQL